MIRLVDIQAGFGGTVPGARQPVCAEQIVAQLRRHQIAGALVRITPESIDFDIERSNARLYQAAAAWPELIPCAVLAPAACGDLPDETAQVQTAIANGCAAVCLRPGPDKWDPEPWVVSPLLSALEAARLPVLCPAHLVAPVMAARFAQLAPDLPLIVAGVSYGGDRTLIPLLKTFPNTYLSIGNNFTAHRGVEFYVQHVGPRRLLYGSGLPLSEPGAAIGQLLYSDLPEPDLALIGSGNFERLRGGIQS